MSGGGRFLFGGVARGLQRALNKAKRAAGIQSCRRHPMQRGAAAAPFDPSLEMSGGGRFFFGVGVEIGHVP